VALGGNENVPPGGLAESDKKIIYLDRNNTPDVWSDIITTIHNSSYTAPNTPRDYRTVVLLPKQEHYDKSLYRAKNPICPHLIYECCKRIFHRKSHGCLSGDNKPKAVEVVLKFAKLHDGVDFEDNEQMHSFFDDILFLDFMKYSSREQPLLPATINGMIQAYNATPENFQNPPDEIIENVIRLVVQQMELDSGLQIKDFKG
jgi:hypothetical protein